MERSVTELLALEIARLLAPLKELNVDARFTEFVKELGWRFSDSVEISADLGELVDLVEELALTLIRLAQVEDENQALDVAQDIAIQIPPIIIQLEKDIPKIQTAINSTATADVEGEVGAIAGEITRRVFDYLIFVYLKTYHRQLFGSLHILGIAEVVNGGHDIPVRKIWWERIEYLFSDPLRLAEEVYTWSSGFNGEEFLRRLEVLTRAFSLPGGVYPQNADLHSALQRDSSDLNEFRIPIYQAGRWPDNYTEFDLNVSPVPAIPPGGDNAGLVVYPYATDDFALEWEFGGGWKLALKAHTDLVAGFAVELRAPHSLALATNLFSGTSPELLDARLEASLEKSSTDGPLIVPSTARPQAVRHPIIRSNQVTTVRIAGVYRPTKCF